ncbi:MAG TPA: hypothetical protein VGN69_11400, partial [Solirubrobacteraceae bacterium]|nr:hypothetical protein [Solirubrobacteraceae bacterium]
MGPPAAVAESELLRTEVQALAGMIRSSAGPGERASAAWIAARLRQAGVAEVQIDPIRAQATYVWSHALHTVAGLVAGTVGRLSGAALALGALVSLELEVSGRRQWLRRCLPAGEGANV